MHYRESGRFQGGATRARRWLACAVFGAALGAAPSDSLVLLGAQPEGSRRPITQDEWARDLAQVLGAGDVLNREGSADEAFGLLCPDRAERSPASGGRRAGLRSPLDVPIEVPGQGDPGQAVRMRVNVPAPALYQLRAEGAGIQRWTIDRVPVDHLDLSVLGVAFSSALVPLSRGPHEIAVYMGRNGRIDQAELVAYRALCMAPAEGWQSGALLRRGDRARTLVQAMGAEWRLPIEGRAQQIEGERYVEASAAGSRSSASPDEPASAGRWAVATRNPSEFSYRVQLAQPGVVTIEASLRGASPQIWSIDGYYRVIVWPEGAADAFAWNRIVALPLAAGSHVIRARVARDAGIDVIRLQRHRAADSDYMGIVEELGLSGGSPRRLVTRAGAHADLTHPAFLRHASRGPGALRLLRGVSVPRAEEPLAPSWLAPYYGPPPLPPLLPSEI